MINPASYQDPRSITQRQRQSHPGRNSKPECRDVEKAVSGRESMTQLKREVGIGKLENCHLFNVLRKCNIGYLIGASNEPPD